MKKQLLTFCLALFGLSIANASVDWSLFQNLAKDKPVMVSSNESDAKTITDNNDGTSWQAKVRKNITEDVDNDWVIINLENSETFTDFEIYWEASHPLSYTIYLSENQIPFTSKTVHLGNDEISYNEIDNSWLSQQEPISIRKLEGESNVRDEFTLDTPAIGQYLLIYCTEYNNNAINYGSRVFEIRVANVEGRDNISKVILSDLSLKEGENQSLTLQLFNGANEPVDNIDEVKNISLTSSDPNALSVTPTENPLVFNIIAQNIGTYSLTATVNLQDGTELIHTNDVFVGVDWNKRENIAQNSTVIGRTNVDSEKLNPAENVVDGNLDTYYQYNGDGEGWIVIDLQEEHLIDVIEVNWGNNGNGSFAFSFGKSDAQLIEESDVKWTDDNLYSGWISTSSITRASNSITQYISPEPISARYIAVRDKSNPGGAKPQLKEVLIEGTEYKDAKLSSLEIVTTLQGSDNQQATDLITGEKVEISYVFRDQYGVAIDCDETPSIEVSENASMDGNIITVNEAGEVFLTASVSGLSAELTLNVFDRNTYCMQDVTFSSSSENTNFEAITDGKEDPSNPGSQFILCPDMPAGAYENWILAEFEEEMNLDMIIAIWEGAAPRDYDVYLGSDLANLEKIYSVTGHTQKNWYDRFSSEDMKGVKYIKIVTTYNATGYGLKLFELKAYGTPTHPSVTATVANLGAKAWDPGKIVYEDAIQLPVGYTLNGIDVTVKPQGMNKLESEPSFEESGMNGWEWSVYNAIRNGGTANGVHVSKCDAFLLNDPEIRLVEGKTSGYASIELSVDCSGLYTIGLVAADGNYIKFLPADGDKAKFDYETTVSIYPTYVHRYTYTIDGNEYKNDMLNINDYHFAENTTDKLSYNPDDVERLSNAVVFIPGVYGADIYYKIDSNNNLGEGEPDGMEGPEVLSVRRRASSSLPEGYEGYTLLADQTANLSDLSNGGTIHLVMAKNGAVTPLETLEGSETANSATNFTVAIDNNFVTGVIAPEADLGEFIDVYTFSGVSIAKNVRFEDIRSSLTPGLYIIGNKKVLIR